MTILNKWQFDTVVKTVQNNLNYDFDSKQAEAFGITLDKDLSVKITPIASDGDVYVLLEENDDLIASVNTFDAITIATCGWAAPIKDENGDDYEDQDLPPSQHPNRRRVRLFITGNKNKQVGSSITFKDSNEDPVYDFGKARGSLADALGNLFDKAK